MKNKRNKKRKLDNWFKRNNIYISEAPDEATEKTE